MCVISLDMLSFSLSLALFDSTLIQSLNHSPPPFKAAQVG